MRKKALNILTLIISIVFLLSFLSGCSSTSSSSKASSSSSTNALNSGSNQAAATVSTDSSAKTTATTIQAPVVNKAPTNAIKADPNSNRKPTTVNPISVNTTTVNASTVNSTLTAAVNVTTDQEYREYVVTSLSQGKDLAVNLQGKFKADTIGEKTMKIIETSGYSGYITGIQYGIYNNVAYMTVNYKGGTASYLTKIAAVDAKVQEIVNTVVTTNMSDYDKELALHDYVVNNVNYDYDNYLKNTIPEESFTAYGALLKGVAVCEGYSEAMYKLLKTSGVKASIIIGESNEVPHAWNLVNIAGGIYHLDATFDDPPSKAMNVLTHNYFNVNDSQISKDHSWNKSDFQKSTAIGSNYFIVNNLVANNVTKYYELVKDQLNKKNTIINIRTTTYAPKTFTSDIVYKVLKDNANINNVDITKGIGFDYDQNSNVITIIVSYN